MGGASVDECEMGTAEFLKPIVRDALTVHPTHGLKPTLLERKASPSSCFSKRIRRYTIIPARYSVQPDWKGIPSDENYTIKGREHVLL